MSARQTILLLPVLAVAGAGCTGEEAAGQGALQLSVSGGAALRDGFPYNEGSTTFSFVDGWTLKFSKYIVSVGNLKLSEPGTGAAIASWAGPAVLDLGKEASGSVDLVTLEELPARRHDLALDFAAVAAAADNRNVEQTDLDLMAKNQWSLLVAGEAAHSTKGSVRFQFGLPIPTHYYECINGKDKTQGIAVEAQKTTGAFIYAHAVHMFWDTLGTGDEDLRFDAFAAVKGNDDLVTEEELKGQDLNDLRDEQGKPLTAQDGKPIFYNDIGKLAPGQQTLYHFLIEAMRASVPFNGIGLCTQRAL